jgi:murein tripeptide amidase MpaA
VLIVEDPGDRSFQIFQEMSNVRFGVTPSDIFGHQLLMENIDQYWASFVWRPKQSLMSPISLIAFLPNSLINTLW